MTITAAAADLIHKWLRTSEQRHPVVQLVVVSDVPPELSDDGLKSRVSRAELEQIAMAALAKLPKYLYQAVYPRSHFLWIFTTKIGGFRFASLFFHPRHARAAMKRGVLDAAERGLILRDANGTVILPTPSLPVSSDDR